MKKTFSKINKRNKNGGFTLVEMLVSVAIFSIIFIIVLGTIVSIVDISRKTRDLTEIMNNLNFTFESMTRALKTATNIQFPDGETRIIATDQNNLIINYYLEDGSIYKKTGNNLPEKVTSDEILIKGFFVTPIQTTEESLSQPGAFIFIEGEIVNIRGITSTFKLQTSVSQRSLDLNI